MIFNSYSEESDKNHSQYTYQMSLKLFNLN